MRRYGVIAGACAALGVVGYAVEIVYFGDNETVSSAWRITATSLVGLLLVSAAVAAVLARKGGAR